MKHGLKRLIALILTLSMCLSMLSATAWAAETETVGEAVAEITAEEDDAELVLEDTAEESADDTAPSEIVDTEAEETSAEVVTDEESSDETGSEEALSDSEESTEEDTLSEDAVKTDEEEDETVSATTASGTCGDNLTWTLSSAGKLTISGTGEMTDWDDSSYVPWCDDCDSITSVSIGNSVTSIGSWAFCNCWYITSVSIGSSVTSIGSGAFNCCGNLTSLTIPSSVTSIGSDVFSDCESLTAITVDSGNTVYSSSGGVLFNKKKTNLIAYPAGKTSSSYTIPSTVTSVDDYAFNGCEKLTSVTIPDSVTSIGYYSFAYCEKLTSVTIPDSVTTMEDYAFDNCVSLTSVAIGSGVTSIGEGTFEFTGLTSVTIGSGVTSIGKNAFFACEDLTSLTIPDNVKTIKGYAFADCDSLVRVVVPESVTSIGNYAFGYVDYDINFHVLTGFTLYGYSGSAAETYASKYSITFVTLPLSAPSISLTNASSGITIKWSKISGATGYQIYVSTSSDFSSGTKSTTTTSTSQTITDLTSGTTYYVKLRAYVTVSGTKYYSSWSSSKNIKYLAAGKISSLTNTASGITVKWSEVTGASGYYVYRKSGSGSYSKVTTVSSGSTVSYTDKKATTNGTKYTYYVVPYSGSVKGSYTTKYTYRLSRPTLSSAKNSAKKTMTIKWAKNSKATGYQIYVSTSSSFSSGTKSTTATGTSKKITGLTKGKTYYVKIRAYKTVSGTKYYSAWSASKKVKISK